MTEDQWVELDKTLSKLAGKDLGSWDQDFVDDMTKRLAKWGTSVTVTARQWEQIERMKGQYL
jgi:hypothetical protein